MPWMETYCLYCSVRLGVMVISALSFISFFIQSIIFFAMGLNVLKPILKLFNEDANFKNHAVVNIVTDEVENDSNSLKVLLQLYFFTHMGANILAFYGSLQLKKFFLLPIIFLEFWRVIFYFAMHVLIMMVSKSHVDLGILITNTLVGGFIILYLGYNWVTRVALYQIINLINSERYKAIYGDDPFNILIPKTYNPKVTEYVRILVTPTNRDISEQKKRDIALNTTNENRSLQPQPIISVLPVNYLKNNSYSNRNNFKWKQSQWPTTTVNTMPTAQEYPTPFGGNSTQRLYKRNDNFEINFNNWQWSEIAPAISARNTNNIYLK